MDEMSPKLQNQIAQFQQLQQQLQAVLSQKFQMEAQLREVNNTIEELEKIDDETPIFKNVGSILMKTRDKESTIEEIKENAYLQYFIGYEEFSHKPPFDPSLFVTLRERLGLDTFDALNQAFIAGKEKRQRRFRFQKP